jgi:hypothetical protein
MVAKANTANELTLPGEDKLDQNP